MHREDATDNARAPIPGWKRRIAIILGAVLAVQAGIGAEGVIVHRFDSDRPEPELEEVLYLSLGVELSNLGYSSAKGRKGGDYLLTTRYAARGNEADLALTLSAAEDSGTALAQEAFVLHIDLSLEDELAAALARLLEKAGLVPAAGGSGTEIAGLFSSELTTVEATLRTTETLRLEVAASGGGALFIGDFSEYAAYCAGEALQAGALFIGPDRSLSVGVRVAGNRTFLNSGVSGGTVYLSSAGLNLQYGIGASQRNRLSACVSGGGAVITLDGEDGPLSKTVPYADAGVQAGFPIGRDLFLGGELRFFAVFDHDMIILGPAAGLTICREF